MKSVTFRLWPINESIPHFPPSLTPTYNFSNDCIFLPTQEFISEPGSSSEFPNVQSEV